MKLQTSEYTLDVDEEAKRFRLRQHEQPDVDTWVNARQGELWSSKIKITPRKHKVHISFDHKHIGSIAYSDREQIDVLCQLIEFWNKHVGPTDLVTARTAMVLGKGRELVDFKRTIGVFALTWNMFGSLSKVTSRHWKQIIDYSQDIIVLNFQESDPLNRNLVANQQTLQHTVDSVLVDTHEIVSKVQLLGLMTLVLVRKDLVPYVSHVHKDSSGTGFLRVWGNKGAVLTRFNLYNDALLGGGAQFMIVNCHLTAGENVAQMNRRRWELSEISRKFGVSGLSTSAGDEDFQTAAYEFDAGDDSVSDLSVDDSDVKEPARYRRASVRNSDFDIEDAQSESEEEAIKDIPDLPPDKTLEEPAPEEAPSSNSNETREVPQFVVLAGDLNYRLQASHETALNLIRQNNITELLQFDSLSLSHRNHRVLVDFYEAPIKFLPTYKFVLGTDDYAYRVPSYTDRIFFKSQLDYKVSKYRSFSHQSLSDHRPVYVLSTVNFLSVDEEKCNKIIDDSYRMVDKAENESIPVVDVEPQAFTIKAPVLSIASEYIRLTSKSTIPTTWSISRANNEPIVVTPHKGVLEPGKTQVVLIKTQISVKQETLSEILVVSFVGGADRFVSATFEREPTCVGKPLSEMVQKDSGGVPTPIWACVDYLRSRSVPGIFISDGEDSITSQVIQWLDAGGDLDIQVLDAANQAEEDAGTLSVANALYLILENLPEPLIGKEPVFAWAASPQSLTEASLLESLPRLNANVVIFLLGFMRHILAFGSSLNKLRKPFETMLLGHADKSWEKDRENFITALLESH